MGGRGCYKISAGRMNNPIKKNLGEEIKTLILEIIYQKFIYYVKLILNISLLYDNKDDTIFK